jgi:tetratricopeptide (TPR) repeat protein
MSKTGRSVLLVFAAASIFIAASFGFAASKIDIQGEIVAGRSRIDKPALVRLLSGKLTIQETLADERGRFKFKNVERGSYVIHVECDGYYGQDVPVMAGDSTPHVRITLQPAPDETPFSHAFDPFRELDIPRQAKKEFELGMRVEKSGGCAKAMSHLQKAAAIYVKYGDAYSEIGRCDVQMENLAAAEASFKKAVQFASNVYPSVDLANLYVTQQRLDEAEALIVPLIRKNPTEGDLYAAMARIYFARGRTHDAEIAGLEAHSRGHRSPDVHLILGKIYESQHNRAALTTQLTTYLDENPNGTMADQIRKQLLEIQNHP